MEALRIDPSTIEIDGRKIDMSVFHAMTDPDCRLLWAFIEKDGVIQAISYSEEQVIWIDKGV
jgi:hypothetical protein